MALKQEPIRMVEVTQRDEIESARARRERFDRNSEWLQSHIAEIYTRHRGKCIVVAGEELFVACTPEEAIAMAQAAHPKDDGSVIRYIPERKIARVYANRRRMAAV